MLASKTNLATLKTKVNNLYVDKLKTVPADLPKLSNAVDTDVKKTIYDKFVIKVNAIDTKILSTSGLVTATQYDSDKQGLEKNIADVDKKIPNTDGLVKKMDYNIKITEIENKIPDTTGLTTTPEFN